MGRLKGGRLSQRPAETSHGNLGTARARLKMPLQREENSICKSNASTRAQVQAPQTAPPGCSSGLSFRPPPAKLPGSGPCSAPRSRGAGKRCKRGHGCSGGRRRWTPLCAVVCQLLAPISHSFLTLGWKTIIHCLHCPDSAGGPPGGLATASAPQGQVRLCYDSVPTSAPKVLGYNINQTEHPSQSPDTDMALLMQTQHLHSNSKHISMPGDLIHLTITMLGSLSLGGGAIMLLPAPLPTSFPSSPQAGE